MIDIVEHNIAPQSLPNQFYTQNRSLETITFSMTTIDYLHCQIFAYESPPLSTLNDTVP